MKTQANEQEYTKSNLERVSQNLKNFYATNIPEATMKMKSMCELRKFTREYIKRQNYERNRPYLTQEKKDLIGNHIKEIELSMQKEDQYFKDLYRNRLNENETKTITLDWVCKEAFPSFHPFQG